LKILTIPQVLIIALNNNSDEIRIFLISFLDSEESSFDLCKFVFELYINESIYLNDLGKFLCIANTSSNLSSIDFDGEIDKLELFGLKKAPCDGKKVPSVCSFLCSDHINSKPVDEMKCVKYFFFKVGLSLWNVTEETCKRYDNFILKCIDDNKFNITENEMDEQLDYERNSDITEKDDENETDNSVRSERIESATDLPKTTTDSPYYTSVQEIFDDLTTHSSLKLKNLFSNENDDDDIITSERGTLPVSNVVEMTTFGTTPEDTTVQTSFQQLEVENVQLSYEELESEVKQDAIKNDEGSDLKASKIIQTLINPSLETLASFDFDEDAKKQIETILADQRNLTHSKSNCTLVFNIFSSNIKKQKDDLQ
jgi:hypothetical protein